MDSNLHVKIMVFSDQSKSCSSSCLWHNCTTRSLQENYDDDQVDPYHGKQEEQQAPEDLDLPDDLHLDDIDNDDGKEEEPVEEEMGEWDRSW